MLNHMSIPQNYSRIYNRSTDDGRASTLEGIKGRNREDGETMTIWYQQPKKLTPLRVYSIFPRKDVLHGPFEVLILMSRNRWRNTKVFTPKALFGGQNKAFVSENGFLVAACQYCSLLRESLSSCDTRRGPSLYEQFWYKRIVTMHMMTSFVISPRSLDLFPLLY